MWNLLLAKVSVCNSQVTAIAEQKFSLLPSLYSAWFNIDIRDTMRFWATQILSKCAFLQLPPMLYSKVCHNYFSVASTLYGTRGRCVELLCSICEMESLEWDRRLRWFRDPLLHVSLQIRNILVWSDRLYISKSSSPSRFLLWVVNTCQLNTNS